jgi:hypothetical protein
MTASRVPILWLVVDDEAELGKDVRARTKFTSLIHSAANADPNGALLRFLNDVAKNRVLETGTSVFEFALKADRPEMNGPLRWTDEASRIESVEQALINTLKALISSGGTPGELSEPQEEDLTAHDLAP